MQINTDMFYLNDHFCIVFHMFICDWYIIWAVPCKMCLWAYVDSEGPDKPVHPCSLIRGCSLTESLDTTECINREQSPGWYFVHAQDDLNLCILWMFEALFASHGPYSVHWFWKWISVALIWLYKLSMLGKISAHDIVETFLIFS